MKTYLRNHEISLSDVTFAYYKWTRSKSGHKNGHLVSQFYGDSSVLISEIYQQIKNRDLQFLPIRYYNRVEPTNQKVRRIGVQSIKQQVCDYLVVTLLSDLYHAKLGYYQSASIPGKGQIFASKHISKWYQDGKPGYFVHLDIKKCYPSMNQEVIMSLYSKYVGSEDVLYVISRILQSYGSGLNIGSYFSQYTANFVLSFAYHEMEGLSFSRRGKLLSLLSHQLWYMDDVLLMSNNKKSLARAVKHLEEYLVNVLKLHIKPWKICKKYKDPLDMCGFVIKKTTVGVRKFTFKKARRAFRRFLKKPYSLKIAHRCVSYYGFLKWTTGGYINRIKYIVERAKSLISQITRRKNYEVCS